MEWGDKDPTVNTEKDGGGIRSGMLTTTARRVGYKEGRKRRRSRGRKTSELNHNQNPDQD